MKKVTIPLTDEAIKTLRAGDGVMLSGRLLTARDCAHKRIVGQMDKGGLPPVDFTGGTIFYAGPCPAKPGMASGSCGPTTSARMNAYAPRLLNAGLKGIIGKGEMSKEVQLALIKNRAVYFAAIGGAGALYASCIKSSRVAAFEDLLSEAVYELEVENFPVIVAYDAFGGSVY